MIGCKIYSIQVEDTLLEMLNSAGTTKTLRIEEIPKEEVNLADDESLIHVAHFHKVHSLLKNMSQLQHKACLKNVCTCGPTNICSR